MIRFIDIRGQGTGYRFAFFDTSVDKFVMRDDRHVWDTWDEILETVKGVINEKGFSVDGADLLFVKRLENLCPEWVFSPPTGHEEDAFYEIDNPAET